MGLLIAIAIPSFLGESGNARSRAVQANLHIALLAAMSVYSTQRSYPAEATLQAIRKNPS
jgi:type II secretory pathway pseudopilin PulG